MREALVVAALLAGLAGSWSPCGLSMVETLERARGGIATFAAGALAGGVVTFGGLAWLGTTLFGPVVALAVAVLVLCALGDAAGRRIVPQVRRQVPESWRRILPVPAAAALYGVLLGLGFTTFLLTFATWALAVACLVTATPATGVAVGLAFGAGRAVPVAVLAARADGAALLAERPGVLRGLRGAVATALLAAAVVLLAAPPAARAADGGFRPAVVASSSLRATLLAKNAADPSASGGQIVWHVPGANGVLRRADGTRAALPGSHPALSGTLIAFVAGDRIQVVDLSTLQAVATVEAPGADAVALSGTHVAWRAGRTVAGRALAGGDVVTVTRAGARESVGRPSLSGGRVVVDQQSPRASRILSRDLARARTRTLRRTTRALLLGPSLLEDGRLLLVRSTYRRQRVLLGRRTIFSTTPTARRDTGYEQGLGPHRQGYIRGRRPPTPPRPAAGVTVTLTTTSADGDTAYVTRLRTNRGRTTARILAIDL